MSRTETTDRRVTIVAIHGVGDRKPGAVLDAVLGGLSCQGKIHSEVRWTHNQGHGFRQADVRGHPNVASVIEVNWDDISHPARSLVEHVTHFFSVVASTLRHAATTSGGGPASWPIRGYRWAFNALLIWCIFLPVVTIGGFVPNRLGQIAWIAATAAVVYVLATVLSPYDERFRAGRLWAAGVVLVGLVSMAGETPRGIALSFATWTYGSVQGLAGLALLAAMGVTWWRSRAVRSEQRFARLAFLYLPFALFTGIGALAWAGTLTIAQFTIPEANLKDWNAAYVNRLIYDLAFAETLLGLGVAIGGILLLLPAPALLRNDSGARVHTRLLSAIKLFPLLVIAVFGLYLVHLVVFADMLGNPNNPYPAFDAWIRPWLTLLLGSLGMQLSVDQPLRVFEIYLASSLRLVPFLAYLVGPFRVLLVKSPACWKFESGMLG
jgi:hypothetical protein